MKLQRSSGVVLHPTSLPSGTLGPDAYAFVDWLAAAGQSWWQVLPLGPPDKVGSPYAAASAFAAWDGFLADPAAPVAARERAAFRRANAFWIEDWAAAGESVDDQVRFDREWSALRAYAARAGRTPDRRRPDLRRAGQRRPACTPRPLPPRPRRRRAARQARPARPALGQSPLRLGCCRARRLPLVDRAPATDARALRPDAHRPLPRLRRVLGDPEGRTRRPVGTLAAGAGCRRLRGCRAGARPAARDRGGSRLDHTGRARTS